MVYHAYAASGNRAYTTDFFASRRVCVNARRTVSVEASSSGSVTANVGTRSTEGRAVEAHSLRIQRLVGQGSFGEVFEGICLDQQETHRVIMKRVKSKTVGAEEMGENEHKLNVYVQKNAAGSCADFFGYTIVERSDRVADKRITPGKWLLWKYQGLKTLRDYLSRRDCLTALAVDLRVPEHVVIPTVIVQLFQCVQKLHAAGLVHRDIKPSNIILCEEDSSFRLIDLGAMADLRTGMNYVPGESILDPYYCPPEQYVLPTDTPDLANTNRMMSLAMSAMLWNRHKPDRFDSYSIGLILMQLAVPQLRMKSGLQNFHKSFKTCRYDLMRWRTISNLSPQQTAVLDANNGTGWELTAALLRPRKVQVLSDGHVYFTNEGKQRPSADAALQYHFLAPAFNPDMTPEELAEGTTSRSSWLGLFSLVQNRVTDLEDEISKTAQQAEETSTTIQKLRSKVKAGEGSELELERAEGMLSNLTGSLSYLQTEMKVALKGARRAFQQGFGEDSESEIDIPAMTPSEEYELSKKIAAEEAAAEQAKKAPTPAAVQWSLAGAMLSGIQSMGRAVQVSGDVVDRINLETQSALEKRKNLNSEEEKFMNMLEQAQVRASAQWPQVAEHFAADPRFTAVPEENRFVLFRSYMRMQQDMHALKLDDTEREYMRRLVQRVTTSQVSWTKIEKQWRKEPFFRAVDPAAAETLFTRHVAKLQQDEAADARERAAELAYRSALECLEPGVSPRCTWADVINRVPMDRVYDHLHDARRESIFEDVQGDAVAAEEQAQAAAAAEAALLRARHEQRERQERELKERVQSRSPNGSDSRNEQEVLRKLRSDQARLKAEYEKMERQLQEMESRLQDTQANGDGATADTQAEEHVTAVSSGRSMNGSRK